MKKKKIYTISEIKDDGFYLSERGRKVKDLAFISLKTALRAYFSTYQGIYHSFSSILDPASSDRAESDYYTPSYVENACEAIVHFHHFVELILKDVLSKEHPLLAADANDEHTVLYSLLMREEASEADYSRLRQLEFSKILTRIIALLKAGKLDINKYGFISAEQEFLIALNKLRNRIMHKGVFVLKNRALDFLFGRHALPLMQKILALPEYNSVKLWKFKSLNLEIDPIAEISTAMSREVQGETYPARKIALLKEMGRAAYSNPRVTTPGFLSYYDEDIKKRAEATAKHVCDNEADAEVKSCPVCGTNSLILFYDIVDDFDYETGEGTFAERYAYNIKCFCCSFEIDHDVSGLDKMGLALDDYWKSFNLLDPNK